MMSAPAFPGHVSCAPPSVVLFAGCERPGLAAIVSSLRGAGHTVQWACGIAQLVVMLQGLPQIDLIVIDQSLGLKSIERFVEDHPELPLLLSVDAEHEADFLPLFHHEHLSVVRRAETTSFQRAIVDLHLSLRASSRIITHHEQGVYL